MVFWSKDFEAAKPAALEKVKPKLDYLQAFVGNNSFALGYLTLLDFEITEGSYLFATAFP
jgi:hypothetical protein